MPYRGLTPPADAVKNDLLFSIGHVKLIAGSRLPVMSHGAAIRLNLNTIYLNPIFFSFNITSYSPSRAVATTLPSTGQKERQTA
jgi:hypothetical protein